VLDVTLTNVPPGVGAGAEQPFAITGAAAGSAGAWPRTAWRSVSDSYFRTLDIPLVRGDGFERQGTQPRVAVVNAEFARQFLAGREPLGQRLHLVSSQRADAAEAEAWTIVGVAADAREAYTYEPVPPVVYVRLADRPPGSVAILARTAGTPLALSGALREAVAAIDPDQPVYGLRDVEYIVTSGLDLNRLSMTLLTLFAVVALALAIAGIYGVVAHTVGQRQREMGLRLALGALPADVLRLIVGDCARYAAVGAGAGLALIILLSGRLATLTRSWAGTDARVLGVAILIVLAAAVIAAFVPAHRAATLDPLSTLRQE
jgi:hypothetical protein